MPPQPGLFSVSYGSTHIQSQSGIATTPSTSSLSISPGIIGPGVAIASGKGPHKGATSSSATASTSQQVYGVPGPSNPHAYNNDGRMYHLGMNGHVPHSVGEHHRSHSRTGSMAGSSSKTGRHESVDDGRKDKKRKDVSNKLGKEMSDRRDDTSGRTYTESYSYLFNTATTLYTRPEFNPMFRLGLHPLSLERSAILAQLENEERYASECAQVAYDEERQRVEEEWKKGRQRVRDRLLEGIEERRKKAREEKEGEGAIGDASLDSHSRQPITRKLRNKLGTSPPSTPIQGSASLPNGSQSSAFPQSSLHPATATTGPNGALSIATGPFLNPHSLSVDEIPSPFPLPLTSTSIPNSSTFTSRGDISAAGLPSTSATGAGGGQAGKRKPKGNGAGKQAEFGAFAKHMSVLVNIKESEIENDLGEIRRGNKRRRAATQAAAMNKAVGAS